MTGAERRCHDLVRDQAKDHYLASLFMPDGKRGAVLALYAFDAELARIPRSVSEPQLGLIRQQWWLETVVGLYAGQVPSHPVAEALASAIQRSTLPRQALETMVTARAIDLHPEPMPDIEGLELYLGQTSSALIQLVALVLAGPAARAAAEAAGLAGVAIGLARHLCQPPPRLLPAAMSETVAIAHARRRLAEARAASSAIPAAALPAFLPASLTGLYLSAASAARPPSQFRRQLTMWWRARANRF